MGWLTVVINSITNLSLSSRLEELFSLLLLKESDLVVINLCYLQQKLPDEQVLCEANVFDVFKEKFRRKL